jgi:release factor glutamine methyltransferase
MSLGLVAASIARDGPVKSIAEVLRDAADRLRPNADNPRLEARLLLAHALGVAQTELLRDLHKPIRTQEFERLVARREAREPIAFILGRQEFWSMEFLVSPATLIPRAASETVVEAALAAFAKGPPPRHILDLGTGTGCLLLALLHEIPGAYGVGVDVSAAAAALARANAARLGLADRSAFVCGGWTDALSGRFDLVVANPPYVATPEMAGLMPEVARFEPRRALEGGADGCDAYREILPHLCEILTANGTAVLEVGAGQADVVSALAGEHGFEVITRLDLAGIVRAMVLSRPMPRPVA